MLEFRYDTQLLIDGHDLDEDVINDYFTEHFKGDCMLAVGDEDLSLAHVACMVDRIFVAFDQVAVANLADDRDFYLFHRRSVFFSV